jgi:hypothetical protein
MASTWLEILSQLWCRILTVVSAVLVNKKMAQELRICGRVHAPSAVCTLTMLKIEFLYIYTQENFDKREKKKHR